MGRLVRRDDHSIAIVGTLERVQGIAKLADEQTSLTQLEYGGGTDIDWDSQTSVRHLSSGWLIFADENGELVYEPDVELIP